MAFEDYPLVSEEVVNSLIEMAGDDSLVKELFGSYLNDLEDLVAKCNDHFSTSNYEGLKSDIHALKGVSGTIGCERMHQVCTSINNDVKSGVFDNLASFMQDFNGTSVELKALIQEKYV